MAGFRASPAPRARLPGTQVLQVFCTALYYMLNSSFLQEKPLKRPETDKKDGKSSKMLQIFCSEGPPFLPAQQVTPFGQKLSRKAVKFRPFAD